MLTSPRNQRIISYPLTPPPSRFGTELSDPISDIISRGISHGEYPDIWKLKLSTPVPKVMPSMSPEELRKIIGLKNISKICEKILSTFVIEDMKIKSDSSQYVNRKGTSIIQYLMKMINKILFVLDNIHKLEQLQFWLNL